MAEAPAVLLRMTGVRRSFGPTRALDGVDLEVRSGEIHALVGENGAGKSTLMKVLAGVLEPDAGSMELAGRPFRPAGPAAARRAGVAMIHQELALCPDLSVEANLLLGVEAAGPLGILQRGANRRRARAALERLGHGDLDLELPAGRLSIALQQGVEIARALVAEARVLILDEPTSSLPESEAGRLFQVLRELRTQGLGIVYISHFLEEVEGLCDRFTVLRDGRVSDRGRVAEAAPGRILRAMVGRELDEQFPSVPHRPGEVLLRVRGLAGRRRPRGVDLDLRRGEILGLAGLVGAGRSEFLRGLYGLEPVRRGEVRIARAGGFEDLPPGSPRRSIACGLGFLSEDRKNEGLAQDLSLADNLSLSRLERWSRRGVLDLAARRAAARELLGRVGCKARGPEQAVRELSGGNQQKVALARLLHQEAEILLLDEPTRGIDVGSKAEIYRLVGELAAAGRAVLVVSSYLPELLHVCDRIGVLCRGRLAALRPAADWSEEELLHFATGGEAEEAA